MKKIPVEEVVGTILAHDLTRIDPGKFKGVAFKKGHVVTLDDIPLLKRIGKENLYILEIGEGQLHEDDAALRIAPAIAGSHLIWTDPREGKSNLVSDCNGLLNVDVDALREINKLGATIVATLKNGTPCQKGQIVAATRIIPLTIERQKIYRLEDIAGTNAPILEMKPYRKMRFGGVVTGSEVAKGLIPDEFEAYVGKKAEAYGCELVRKTIVPDDPDVIAGAIRELKDIGCELILTTGGLSVDPDDVTREGVRCSGAEIIAYGSPVLPGAMFLLARLDNVVILGLPACVFYHSVTIYDLLLPKILAGEIITEDTIADMGHGGLCMQCTECHFPACFFGR